MLGCCATLLCYVAVVISIRMLQTGFVIVAWAEVYDHFSQGESDKCILANIPGSGRARAT